MVNIKKIMGGEVMDEVPEARSVKEAFDNYEGYFSALFLHIEDIKWKLEELGFDKSNENVDSVLKKLDHEKLRKYLLSEADCFLSEVILKIASGTAGPNTLTRNSGR
jgi:hypothetical protein